MNSSIGIIGGADGHTKIFITGDFDFPAAIIIGIVIVALIVGIVIFKKNK